MSGGIERIRPRAGEAAKRIAALIDDNLVEKAVAVLEECLGATRRVRSEAPRGRGEPVQYETIPDRPVQMAAAKTLIEFRHGKARQAIEMTTDDAKGRAKGRDEVLAALAADWERTKRIGESWIEGMKRAEKPQPLEVESLAEVDL